MKTMKSLALVAIFGLAIGSAATTFACDKNGKCSTTKKASTEKSSSKSETKTATKTTTNNK